ncbi:MAG: hypothetical protein MPI93_01965 [Nitrosopumilus sp.]|nr:hypothetical protein [Nitrosopumilus sp.]
MAYRVSTAARIRDGPAHPNPAGRRLFWHDYAIRNAADSLDALDGILPEHARHAYPGGNPRLLAEDLAGLIREYDAPHYGRIACLVMGQQPYRWCKSGLHIIPGCRLPGDERPFDPLLDVRVMYSLNVGRTVSNYVLAVNPSLAFRIRGPVTFATRHDPPRNAAITEYTESHQHICTGASGFRVGLGGRAVP